jgi:hypothetical protein
MLNLLSAAAFLGFVALGLLTLRARSRASAQAGRGAINRFLVFCLLVSFAAGLTQRELWPFSRWELIAGIVPPVMSERFAHPRLVAVDARGGEHEVDYRAWEPLVFDELGAWINQNFSRLPASGQDQAAAYLLSRAEQARISARGGRMFGTRWWPQPLTAPYFLLHPALWVDAARVPERPFVGLRIYTETWNLADRARDPLSFRRVLLFEYREP